MPDAGLISQVGKGSPLPPAGGEAVGTAARRRAHAANVLIAVLAAATIGGLVWYFDRPADKPLSQSVTLSAHATGPGPRVGKMAPDFRVAGLDGGEFNLSAFRGRPVWISFWASWCPPCRAETPDIQAAHERYRDEGLVVLAIDIGEEPDTVRSYVERTGLTFSVGLDQSTEVAALYRISGVPTHYFIDAGGVLRDWKIGSMGENEMDRKLQALLRPGR